MNIEDIIFGGWTPEKSFILAGNNFRNLAILSELFYFLMFTNLVNFRIYVQG